VWRGDRGAVADGLRRVLVGGGAVGAVVGAVDLWGRRKSVNCDVGRGRGRVMGGKRKYFEHGLSNAGRSYEAISEEVAN
jgi:hypothetical protein